MSIHHVHQRINMCRKEISLMNEQLVNEQEKITMSIHHVHQRINMCRKKISLMNELMIDKMCPYTYY